MGVLISGVTANRYFNVLGMKDKDNSGAIENNKKEGYVPWLDANVDNKIDGYEAMRAMVVRFSKMPAEKKTIILEGLKADARSDNPYIANGAIETLRSIIGMVDKSQVKEVLPTVMSIADDDKVSDYFRKEAREILEANCSSESVETHSSSESVEAHGSRESVEVHGSRVAREVHTSRE